MESLRAAYLFVYFQSWRHGFTLCLSQSSFACVICLWQLMSEIEVRGNQMLICYCGHPWSHLLQGSADSFAPTACSGIKEPGNGSSAEWSQMDTEPKKLACDYACNYTSVGREPRTFALHSNLVKSFTLESYGHWHVHSSSGFPIVFCFVLLFRCLVY